MDLVGDELTFVVAGVQEVLEGLMLPLEGLFRLLAIRNVAMRTYQPAGSTLFIPHDDGVGRDPAVGAVLVTQSELVRTRG